MEKGGRGGEEGAGKGRGHWEGIKMNRTHGSVMISHRFGQHRGESLLFFFFLENLIKSSGSVRFGQFIQFDYGQATFGMPNHVKTLRPKFQAGKVGGEGFGAQP